MIGLSGAKVTGHGEGAANILRAKGIRYDPDDEFEEMLLQTLRGPLVYDYPITIHRTRSCVADVFSSFLKVSSIPRSSFRTTNGTSSLHGMHLRTRTMISFA